MAQIQTIFPSNAPVALVTLTSLADAATGAAITLPGTLQFSGPTTVSGGRLYTLNFSAPSSLRVYWGGTVTETGGATQPINAFTAGDAVSTVGGSIIDKDSLTLFLGSKNLAITSQQNNSSNVSNDAVIQQAILNSEARVYSVLNSQPGGRFFKYPFTVNGVPLKSAVGSIALPILQMAAHQYAGYYLNRWRSVMGTPNDGEGQPNQNAIAIARMKDADSQLQSIIQWIMGYSGGLYIDLDIVDGMAPGQSSYVVGSGFEIGGATVNPDGTCIRPIYENRYIYGFGYRPVTEIC